MKLIGLCQECRWALERIGRFVVYDYRLASGGLTTRYDLDHLTLEAVQSPPSMTRKCHVCGQTTRRVWKVVAERDYVPA